MAPDQYPSVSPQVGAVHQDNQTPSLLLRSHYEVVSVAKVEMPNGAKGDDWHCFVLASGPSQIAGYQRGSTEEVMAYAQHCAEDFNLRNASGKSSRVLGVRKAK